MGSPILTFWVLPIFFRGWGGECWYSLIYTGDKVPKEKSSCVSLIHVNIPVSIELIITYSWGCRFLWSFPVHKDHTPCIVCSLSSSLAVEGRSWRQGNGDATGPCIPVSSDDKDASESEDLLEKGRQDWHKLFLKFCSIYLFNTLLPGKLDLSGPF